MLWFVSVVLGLIGLERTELDWIGLGWLGWVGGMRLDLRSGDHVCLEDHLVEHAVAVDEILFGFWKMQSPGDEVCIDSFDCRIILDH